MKIEIKNAYLKQSSELLFDLSLKGKQSRHRSKLIKLLNEQSKEVDENRVELAKEHSNLDDEGEPLIKKEKYDIKDENLFRKDLNDLYNESFIIEGENNKVMLKTVSIALKNCDKEFSGTEAMIYDHLCEQFEKGEDKK